MKKRKCTSCKHILPISSFNFRSRKLRIFHPRCKKCLSHSRRIHYLKNRKELIMYSVERNRKKRIKNRDNMYKFLSERVCIVCGEDDIRVFEFDHVRGKKKYTISNMFSNSWDTILKEISKCDILCANCHRKRTAQTFNWYKSK